MSFGDLKVQDLIYEDSSNNEITVVIADLATKANPVFSGTVTVPTATAGDNSTKAASTAFVVASFAPKNAPAFTGSATGVNLTLSGDLTVNGTTTTINTTTLQVEDKNIEIGKVASPSDTTADGGGWTLLGATNKTFNWLNATDSWTSSEHIEIASGKNLKVDGTTFFVDGTNNRVGIGTVSPATELHVQDSSGDCLIRVTSADGSGAFLDLGDASDPDGGRIVYDTGSNLILCTASSERMRIDQYGRALLGTTTAGEGSADDLTIATTDGSLGQTGITIRSGTSAGGQIYFADGTSGDDRQRGIISYQHGGNYMRFYTNASERLRITEDGAIGIGGATYGTSGQVLTSGGSGAAPSWANPAAGGNTVELVADGAIANNKAVIITTAGKAAQVAEVQTGRTNAPTNKLIEDLTTQDEFYSMVWDSNREVVVMGYANSNGGRGVNVFTYSTAIGTSTVTNHGQTTAQTANCSDNTSLAFDPDTNQFLFCYRLQTAGFLSVGTVASDKSVTFGSASEWDGQSPDEMYVEYNTDQNKVIVVFRKSNQLWARAGTVSGTGISGWGTAVQLSGIGISNDGKLDTCWDSTNNKVLVVFCDTDDNNKAKAVALSCSGTTLTWGSPSQLYNGQTLFPRIAFDSDLGKATATYEETSTNRGVMQVVYISSGTTIASGSAEYMTSTIAGISGNNYVHLKGHQSVYDPVGKYFYIVACWTNSPTATDRVFSYQWKINNSNNTITRNTQYIRLLDSSTCQDHKWNNGMVVMGDYGKMVSVVRNIPNSYKPRLYLSELITSSTNITDRNVIGFANSAINDTATGTINVQGSVATGQSGLTPGQTYFVQNDGTLGNSVVSTQANLLAIASDKGLVQTRTAWT